MKKHNFYAGPSILPQYTIKNTAEAVLDFAGTGLSLLEISHRSKEFQAVMDETQALFKELLDVPAGYEVVFVGGGASLQFCMVPYNILNKKAAYLKTGVWAKKAQKEATAFGEVVEVASSEDKTFCYIPKGFEAKVPTDADYFHITTNNTIYGTELHKDPDVKVPLVADMSSDIFSRPIDISKYSIIYGGAQKNLAPAGLAFAIVKVDALGKVDRHIPTMLDYRTHIEAGSMFNTPPCVTVFGALQTLKWLKAEGGVKEMQRRALVKADKLYSAIDGSRIFRPTVTDHEDRSYMNICFVMKDEYKDLEKEFLDFATAQGMIGIKGHRSVGGFRASTYNALPVESVDALVAVMKEFESKH
ncbi:MAG: 3-phosphoserine/phosphohydroxythreonine transaminase [Bacteroidales bacterium]|nr:3-phosphoserine/phosphohydroxythreonine transaminase [Bacteroidales bacterium]